MKLYWGPHTCAIGIHILLEEIGRPYEAESLDVQGGATHAEPFRSINPKGKVPVLVRDDGSALTEYGAIATWLARTAPDKGLISGARPEAGTGPRSARRAASGPDTAPPAPNSLEFSR